MVTMLCTALVSLQSMTKSCPRIPARKSILHGTCSTKRDRLDVMNGVIFPENLAFRADSAGTGLDLVDGNMWVERGATGRRGQVSLILVGVPGQTFKTEFSLVS